MSNEKSPKQDPTEAPQIQINGFKQVLDLLKTADPAFRESLLRRLAQRDAELAYSLRKDLRSEI